MKKGFKKILSIMLSICLLLSVSFVSASITVAAAEKVTDYYVGYGGTGDGSSLSKMAPTVAKAIETINANGFVAGDTVNVWIVQDIDSVARMDQTTPYHNLAAWGGTVPSHTAKIIVKPLSTNQSKNASIPTYLAMDPQVGQITQLAIGGPTEFQNLGIVYCSNQYTGDNRWVISGNGHDLTIGKGVAYYMFGYKASTVANWTGQAPGSILNLSTSVVHSSGTYNNPINLTINSDNIRYHAMVIDFAGNTGDSTYKQDVNIYFNGDIYGTYIRTGTRQADKTIIYEKNLNVKVTTACTIRGKTGSSKVTVKGGVQLITNNKAKFGWTNDTDYSFDTHIAGNCYKDTAFTTPADYWNISVDQADVDKIDFVKNTTGKFEIARNFIATATNATTGVTTNSENGILDLSGAPGKYTVTFTYSKVEEETHNYDDLINYRGYNSDLTKFDGALANTFKKLDTISEFNIVYMGGSGTKGEAAGTWREQVGNWFTNNYQSVTINNIDKSLENTGTTFGALRVRRDVVSKIPNLVFIEYTLDDYKQGVSASKSQMQLETIVREIKEAYPSCDIVVLFASSENMGDELYAQANAHEAICERYDISSINLGSNKDLYFNIISEFLVNTLLFGEYGDSINVTNQTLPEVVNKYLFDGNKEFIYPVDLEFTSVGGSSYDEDAKALGIPDYVGVINLPVNSKDTVTVEFDGTALYMLNSKNFGTDKSFKVSLDGGENWEVKNYSGNIVTKVVSGLDGGKHTAIIEPAINADADVCGFYSFDLEKSTNKLNVCDLVYLDESIDNNTVDYRDYNDDAAINKNDLAALKKILLGETMKPELNSTKHIKPIARLGWRPYTGNLPEQSLISYQKAYDTGHRILLCDIRTTSDGYMVCCHDDDISKVNAYNSNGVKVQAGQVKISETTLADLLTYDFGKYRNQAGLQILQVEDFLSFCKDLGDVTPVLEMKVDITDKQLEELTALIKKYGFEDTIMFVCTDQRFATALPNCTMGDWVYTLTDGVIARMDALTCKGKFVYVARDGGNEDSVNFENYVKCKAKGIDLAITYIPSTYKDYFNGLKDKGIFNYCKYIALDEVSWLYE